jgi:hypothetical protein
LDADAGLKRCIVSFICVAVGDKVRFYTVSVNISIVSNKALTYNTIVCLIGSAGLARSKNPEISIIAITLTILKITIDSTILIITALSVDNRKSSITDTASTVEIDMTIERAKIQSDTFTLV